MVEAHGKPAVQDGVIWLALAILQATTMGNAALP
jgi:hypothetical protein